MTGAPDHILKDIRACRICEALRPPGPRPVLIVDAEVSILIAGQASGTRVHASGIPRDDPSGDRLREWLAVDKETFYNPKNCAIIPQGFCYPVRLEKGGDSLPRLECARTWHPNLIPLLPSAKLTLAVGQYAHKYHLGARRKKTLTATVHAYEEFAPQLMPLPHPSWRVTGWAKKNPWYEINILPLTASRSPALVKALVP